MWTRLIALAVTLPMTITIATAQAAQDADIQAYSQDLSMRIARGRQSGQITPANYNSLQATYNQVEMIRRSLGNKPMNIMVRTNMMNSLTNLDRQLTTYLHDDINSRYQMWDPTKRTWRNNWWTADNSGANSFNDEIDAYQNSLRDRIDRGRASGQITRSELNQLTTSYDNIDRAQQQYRIGGFSSWERNSLMSMLTQLDRDVTAQMQDNENSHYRNWNPNGKSWSNNWWKNTSNAAPSYPGTNSAPHDNNDGRGNWSGQGGWNKSGEGNSHGNWNRDDSNNRGNVNRGETSNSGNWNRGETSNPGNWNRGDAGRTDWNRGNADNGDASHGDTNHGNWNNRGGFGSDRSNDSQNRSGSNGTNSGGSGSSSNQGSPPATTHNPPPSSNPPASGNSSSSGNPPSTGGSHGTSGGTAPSTGAGNPPSGTTPTTGANNPPAGTVPSTGSGNPSGGSGTAGTGSASSGQSHHGTWGGQTGEASGDRTGTGRANRTPQN